VAETRYRRPDAARGVCLQPVRGRRQVEGEWTDGTRGIPGYRQYQEDFGLFFGATNDLGATRTGLVDIALCWLVIR
jgi:hypothetical protein